MFAKEEKNLFYHLPKELIIYIYDFDSTYKTLYSLCINEMTKMFQINRINDRIVGENFIYDVYLHQKRKRRSIYANKFEYNCGFSQYILGRLRTFGDQVPDERLKYHNLTKLK
tara:strand:- start:1662 stop:2000 length:339 start_codon:yes stop_codon:yes gene_type:complete